VPSVRLQKYEAPDSLVLGGICSVVLGYDELAQVSRQWAETVHVHGILARMAPSSTSTVWQRPAAGRPPPLTAAVTCPTLRDTWSHAVSPVRAVARFGPHQQQLDRPPPTAAGVRRRGRRTGADASTSRSVKAPLRAADGYGPCSAEPRRARAALRCSTDAHSGSRSQRADLDTERRARRQPGAPPLSAAAPPAATSYLSARSTL
jgi:hypothetical protein